MINAIDGKDDDVFALRYVFIKYCETAFTHDERIAIEKQLDTRPQISDALSYYDKFQEDGGISHDRKVYRKIYVNNIPKYEEIAILNTTLSAEGLSEIKSELLGLNIKNDDTGAYGIIQVQGRGDNQATGYAAVSLGGWGSLASGECSFTAGIQNFATGKASMALGYCNSASGVASIAMGQSAQATNQGSIALGRHTVASGHAAVALGYNTKANQNYQTVVGAFNDFDNILDGALFVVGNGKRETVDSKELITLSNAFEVYQDGHATLQRQGSTSNSIVIKETMEKAIRDALDDLVGIYSGTTIPSSATEKIVILTG